MKKTAYQKTHMPIRRVEVKCQGKPQNKICPLCGRWPVSRHGHKPNVTGSLGWICTYADGSVYTEKPI